MMDFRWHERGAGTSWAITIAHTCEIAAVCTLLLSVILTQIIVVCTTAV